MIETLEDSEQTGIKEEKIQERSKFRNTINNNIKLTRAGII